MSRNNPISRRTAMKITGAAATTALVAGCSSDSDENGSENGSENGGELEASNWEGVETIEFTGEMDGWKGSAPSQIEGESNPTILLFEGQSYDITWTNGDGKNHNLEIVDDSDEPVNDLSTDQMGEEGETQTLTIEEVTSDMKEYVCRPHESQMRGTIEVQQPPSGGNGDESGNGNESTGNGNESTGNGNESEE
ncbi:plastocyanin/azurin family copper-binding protein [Natrialba aegyptia]|uniref:Blue copper domain-containing protein n=1 Tax=Natrialba aegyptia DSM 13077 TaxID=1227491 RepID=M0B6L2_9EURY|nr:plastocyanin/azurin family copper-binding protein [Natrialba aegyptia]ELZ06526.1 blue copper domain-containing protein [Natrialba aegyptia DSM 13077]